MTNSISVYSDGGSRGNPGPAAIGYVIYQDTSIVESGSRYIGQATNNEAEYLAILSALTDVEILIKKPQEIFCYLDSELVVRQLAGVYKIKNLKLRKIALDVFSVINRLKNRGFNIVFTSIPREKNKKADLLVNQALDYELKKI